MKVSVEEAVGPALAERDRALLAKLQDVINGAERPVLLGREGAHVEIPEPLFHVLTKAVRLMASGQAVTLLSENEEFTTQAAADYLGMSRPHLIKLLEEGALSFHFVGTHRRIYLKDLKEYKAKRDRQRRDSMAALTRKVSEAGLYDSDYTGVE